MMKKLLFTLLMVSSFLQGIGQFRITEGTYHTFDGRAFDVYLIEGVYSVLNIDKTMITDVQLRDTSTLTKLLNRVDGLYAFYKDNMGFEPPGGNPDFGNKVNVFFGSPSCGAGCGLVGAKGIEVGGLNPAFDNLKYDLNVNGDVIIGYEFGRNFFTFSNKILFPFTPNTDEKNGGFAEGFAGLMYCYAYDKILTDPHQRELNETLLNIRWGVQQFRGYINDDSANPYNSFAKWELFGVRDPNRGLDGWTYEHYPSYPGGSILFGLFDTFKGDLVLSKFFEILRSRPNVSTIEDALSNIAYSASFSMEKNLVPFFKNVLRFNITPAVEAQMSGLPAVESRLIRDEPTLWFVSPFDSVKLNLKSTNYLSDNLVYRILIDGQVYSESAHGRNIIKYEVLKGNSEKVATCQLVDNGSIVDQFQVRLRKRHAVNLFDYKQDFYAYYRSNTISRSYFNGETLRIESVTDDVLSEAIVYFNFIFSRNRLYKVTGDERHISRIYKEGDPLIDNHPSSGWSGLGLGGPGRNGTAGGIGPVGIPGVGQGDTVNFYAVAAWDSSNFFMPSDRPYFMNKILVSNLGYSQKTELQNFYFYDITDTDKDGVIDFEDPCPGVYGEANGCPKVSIVPNVAINPEIITYPNPVLDKLTVKNGDKGKISIYDIWGKLLMQEVITTTETNIDVSKFPQGSYLIHFVSENRIQTGKFLKL